ncbi:hypothetical protein EIN_507350 [Entamoeba invadens IP1]|uniref:Ricin B lectin domain-containing protein n=2 Tax=Entamoeba invadens TaxID=33085 RepID=A0A0A1UGM9_ENTIV|nr:hypothetical protein EIN_507350 [Entamoeba invadens IP1]ELP92844.1 hypothetical protein EIN_507350 [Entamoeba invadens IP1]|eukprot:XP_004259615.1 hypothetical protein EIN_507350 [Entamoeba invadens IP1]
MIMTRENELFEERLLAAERESKVIYEMEKDKEYILPNILTKEAYEISPTHCDGLCIDIPRGSADDNTKICLWTKQQAKNQLFQFVPFRSQGHPNCVLIQNLSTGKYLGVAKGKKEKVGESVKQTNNNKNLEENHWTLKMTENGNVNILCAHSLFCLDVVKGGKKAGTELCVWNTGNQQNQKFALTKAKDQNAVMQLKRQLAEKEVS